MALFPCLKPGHCGNLDRCAGIFHPAFVALSLVDLALSSLAFMNLALNRRGAGPCLPSS